MIDLNGISDEEKVALRNAWRSIKVRLHLEATTDNRAALDRIQDLQAIKPISLPPSEPFFEQALAFLSRYENN